MLTYHAHVDLNCFHVMHIDNDLFDMIWKIL